MQTLIQEKADRFKKFFDRITSIHVYLKDEINRFNHKDDRTVEIRVEVPGQSLFVADSAATFEKAISEASQKMDRQLKRYKENLR